MNMPDDIIPMTQDKDKENEKEEIVVKKDQPKVFIASGWSDESVSKAMEKLGGKVHHYAHVSCQGMEWFLRFKIS